MRGDPLLKLDLFRVGSCRAPAALNVTGGSFRVQSAPSGVALIRHPRRGNILFDTGYGPSFFRATAGFPERFYRWLRPVTLPEHERLPMQLAKRGIERPDLVILSHLHGDHVSGLFDLHEVPRRVLSAQDAVEGLNRGRLASLNAGCPIGLRDPLRRKSMQLIENFPVIPLASDELGSFESGFDVLEDGTVIAVPLRGHGRGQFGLYLPRLDGGAAFLIADAAWNLQALRDNRPPPRVTLNRLGNADAYLETFAALRHLQQARPDLRLIPAHCPESFAA